MLQQERRNPDRRPPTVAHPALSEAQRLALRDLQVAGWDLMFIRNQTPPPPPQVIVYHRRSKTFAVIEHDGDLRERPDLRLRA